jgi:hypothetical protein
MICQKCRDAADFLAKARREQEPPAEEAEQQAAAMHCGPPGCSCQHRLDPATNNAPG